jgi:hypothetical protein
MVSNVNVFNHDIADNLEYTLEQFRVWLDISKEIVGKMRNQLGTDEINLCVANFAIPGILGRTPYIIAENGILCKFCC